MNDTLLAYYKNLLILQYRIKDKAQAHIVTLLTPIMIYDLIRAVENGYDIETAVGVQLEVLASYVNAERTVTQYEFSRTFWSLVDYDETTPYEDVAGIVDYDQDPFPDATILTYETDSDPAYSLTDDELRMMIKMKIIQNNSNHSVKEIDELIEIFFEDTIIFTDNKDMTLEYIFDEDSQRIVEIADAQGSLPKPMGVSLLLTYTPDIGNIYGMLNYNSTGIPSFLQGFVDYENESFGGMLSY